MGNEQGCVRVCVRKDGMRATLSIGRCVALRDLRELYHIFRYVTICDLSTFSSLEHSTTKPTIRYLTRYVMKAWTTW